tara:strand:- start:2874 stop:3554 length:681 start_codon:yes stop_codon:yes gene_type:complete
MFSLVIPIYNESENLINLVKEIDTILNNNIDYEIILINDASTDNTKTIIKKISNKKIRLLNNSINKGQSFCIRFGVENAKYKTIITLDGDGQNDPADIPKLLEIYNSNIEIELVSGIRHKRKDSLVKKISSKIANFVRSVILKDGCKDTGCALKIFNKNIFLSFPYFDGIHRFLPALFTGYGYKTYFINVNHRNRKYGISKYGTANRLFRGIRDIIKVLIIIKNKK